MKIKIGVIFGGCSVEHDVSIITAVQAMENIDENKYDVIPIYIDKERNMYTGHILKSIETYKDHSILKRYSKKVSLIKNNDEFELVKTNGIFRKVVNTIDIAMPIVHGKGIEDGSIAGFLDSIGIPYVGPDVLGAALGQDKVVQKQVLKAEGINVVDFIWFYENEYKTNEDDILKNIKKLGYPVVVKPAKLGSSIGINYVADDKTIIDAINDAIQYDDKIIVEKAVDNLLEIDCAVLGDSNYTEVSLIGEMLTDNEILTFEDKYLSGGGKKSGNGKLSGTNVTSGFRIPAEISKKMEEEIYDISRKAFRALNLTGVTRFDFLVNKKTKEIYVNEPNTIPGCLAFFFFTPKGKTYTELLDNLVTLTIKRYKNSVKKVSFFDSNVLSTYGNKSGVKGKLR